VSGKEWKAASAGEKRERERETEIGAHPGFEEDIRGFRVQEDDSSVDIGRYDFQDSKGYSTEGDVVVPLEEIEDE